MTLKKRSPTPVHPDFCLAPKPTAEESWSTPTLPPRFASRDQSRKRDGHGDSASSAGPASQSDDDDDAEVDTTSTSLPPLVSSNLPFSTSEDDLILGMAS